MKRWLLIGSSVMVVAFGIAAAVWSGSSRNPSTANPPSTDPAVPLGVDDLMRNVERYRNGSVLVEGVVSLASAADKTLTLIDNREFEKCGLGCAELMLPVRWSGTMPAVKERVRIEGQIQEDGGKLIFVARSVDRLGAKGE